MPTLKGRVLLGWLQRDEAVRFLLNDCAFDPPMDEPKAESLWANYRARVDALAERAQSIPVGVGLTPAEAGHGAALMAFLHSIGRTEYLGVKKIDLRELTVRQYMVTTERSEEYAAKLTTEQAWLHECLPLTPTNGGFSWRHSLNGMNGYIECDVPHGEWIFAPLGNGAFAPIEGLRHITAMDGGDRTFLWAGYHRSFARVLTTPIANAPTALVAVARNVLISPAAAGVTPGVATNAIIDPLGPFGAKAARFGDFFVDGLFMDVDLRKKRYQLQVHANWVALDDPN